jgi:hypothetical protein
VAVELANLGVAIRTYLRESTTLAHADYLGSNDRITVDWPADKADPIKVPRFQNRIIILAGRGGPGDVELGIQVERVDIACYGSNAGQCYKIWRALDFYLNPIGVRRKTSFTRNGCQVNTIVREGGPLRLVDPDAANWPYTVATYLFNYNGQVRE